VLTLGAAVTAAAVPFWIWIVRMKGKRFAWAAGTALVLAGTALWWLANGHGLVPLLLAMAVISVGQCAGYICFWAVLPDTVEYGEWRTGTRTESLVFGLVVLGQKAALGIAAGGLGVALSLIGYLPNEGMLPATSDGLRMMMLVIPVVGAVVSLLLILNYRLSYEQHQQMVRDIDERASQAEA